MSEDISDPSEIFAKMRELQRSIEETKKSLTANNSKPIPASYDGNRSFTPRGYSHPRGFGGHRGAYRGSNWSSYRGSTRKPYRNMSLVLNNNSSTSGSDTGGNLQHENNNMGADQFVSKVSKNGLSIVNTKIFQSSKERQIELNQKILQLKIDKIQHSKKLKIQQKLQELSVKYDYCNRVYINGIEMAIVNDNVRLVPISYIEDEKYKNNIEFEGYKYNKLGDGSYLQNGHEESELPRLEELEPCRFYTRTGVCARGKGCKYTHNPSNISMCKEFLKNQCPNPNCPLSHKPSQFNSPTCKFFLNGFCSNANCLFTHKQEGEEKRICRNFSIGGFCRLGKYCPLKHNFNCPDFVERHNCPRGKACTLVHYLDGSNAYVNSAMELVRNEDNDPNGINYQAQPQPLAFEVESSEDEDYEEDEIEDGEVEESGNENETLIERSSTKEETQPNDDQTENDSDENLIDISDSSDSENVAFTQTGDKGEELQENIDYVKL